MANQTNIIKGSSFLFTGKVEGLVGNSLTDEGVDITAEFYINGTHSDPDHAKVEIPKTSMMFDEDQRDTFSCYVSTENLTKGTLACAITVKYPSETAGGVSQITEIIPATFSESTRIVELS